jgi:hypothetical protein
MGTLCYGHNTVFFGLRTSDFGLRLDRPFNSAQTYNAFFQEKDGASAASARNTKAGVASRL